MASNTNVNSYTVDGRIKQVEYAMKAMNLGTTTVSIRTEECVVLASEKKLTNELQCADTIKKHFKVYDRIVFGCTGVSADAPSIIEKCRNICIHHYNLYDEQIPTERLVEKICSLALQFSESDFARKIYSRPFGVSMLVAAYDSEGPKLFCIDPSGSFVPYKAKAIGAAFEIAETQLVKEVNETDDADTAISKALTILKSVMKDKMEPKNVELSVVDKTGIRTFSSEMLSKYIS